MHSTTSRSSSSRSTAPIRDATASWRRRVALAAAGALAVVATGATAAAGAPPGPRCGDTITGEVHLTRNLTCTDVGLVLAAGAVLDLDGHTLRGPGGTAGWALQTDTEDTPSAPVTVRDGRVVDWGRVLGDELAFMHVVLEDVVMSRNGIVLSALQVIVTVADSRFTDNGTVVGAMGGAADVVGSTFARNTATLEIGPAFPQITVADSVFADNSRAISCDEGRVTVDASTFRRNTTAIGTSWCSNEVTGSTFADNGTAVRTRMVSPTFQGLVDTFSQNRFVRNGTALDLGVGASVLDNVLSRNGRGIWSSTADALPVEEMLLEGNTVNRSAESGVWIDTPVSIGTTTANHNGGHGIYAPQATDLGGNTARGNGAEPQCVGVRCGPRS